MGHLTTVLTANTYGHLLDGIAPRDGRTRWWLKEEASAGGDWRTELYRLNLLLHLAVDCRSDSRLSASRAGQHQRAWDLRCHALCLRVCYIAARRCTFPRATGLRQ
jgi:hypothetical protein